MSLSSQLIVVCVQALAEQPSVVQTVLSLHEAGTVAVCTHPVAGTHESVVQMSLSSQLIGVNTQLPPTHASVVQALLSSQITPAQGSSTTQLPVAGSQAEPGAQVTDV